MTAVKILLAVLPFSVFAASCSKSHGGDAAPLTPGVQITTANGQEIARVALQAAFGLADVGSVSGGLLAHPFGSSTSPALLSVKALVQARVDELVVGGTLLAASLSETLPGTAGGQVIHTWDDRDGDEKVSTGDAFVSAFTDYRDGTTSLSGVVTVDGIVVFGEPPAGQTWGIAGRMNFVNLQVTVAGGEPQTIAGSVRFSRERRQTVEVLDLDLDDGLVTGSSVLQPGTAIGYIEFPADYGFAVSAHGAVQADGIVGLIEFDTTQVFTGLTLLPYPWAGVLEVRGAGGSLITVQMTDYTSSLTIAIDADGDGEVDETVAADWTTL